MKLEDNYSNYENGCGVGWVLFERKSVLTRQLFTAVVKIILQPSLPTPINHIAFKNPILSHTLTVPAVLGSWGK